MYQAYKSEINVLSEWIYYNANEGNRYKEYRTKVIEKNPKLYFFKEIENVDKGIEKKGDGWWKPGK